MSQDNKKETASGKERFDVRRRRLRFLGLTLDDVIKYFFEGNAVVSIIVLGLITLFLFREGFDFFGQNRQNLMTYRRAGLEYVDFVRSQEAGHIALTRYLSDLRSRALKQLTKVEGRSLSAANAALAPFDEFSNQFSDAINPLRGVLGEMSDFSTELKTKYLVASDRRVERRQLEREGRDAEAAKVQVDEIDYVKELQPLLAMRPVHREESAKLKAALLALLQHPPELPGAEIQGRMTRFGSLVRTYCDSFSDTERSMDSWDYKESVSWSQSISAFIFGRQWLTASFWQDWYGIIPLFTGSLLVSVVALALAIPLGVGAALYVNQLASAREQTFIKPCIEFISAIPSVVLGFFGIAVLGQALRTASHWEWLSWMPGFPFSERLNVLTAGCLLALIAIPTIFTLAEDALNNVPRSFKEASFALGATRLQTIIKVIMPAAISGIISAILLGLARVFGETMVVLLCAGNRISIPDFSAGLGVVTQPVHTMTGIIAQEMGEVVQGSIHYRALFVVGITLFFLSLIINYMAQKIVRKYRVVAN